MANRYGQQIDDYRLTDLLGTGSYGEVYLAEHLHDHSLAAVKVLKLAQEGLKGFIKEVSTIFRLQHPHIVHMHAFGITSDDLLYLVMDYAPNGTLRQRHPKGTQLALATVVSYLIPLASALQYAHDRHVIHRDIKPENILIGADGTCLLSDFGIALLFPAERSLTTQNIGGTPPYIAPEQIRGKPCPASDQYALGIMVYEWLCGTRPFHGSLWELFEQHQRSTPPPLHLHRPDLPPQVEALVLQTLAKDPNERFENVVAFAREFEQANRCRQVVSEPSNPFSMELSPDKVDASGKRPTSVEILFPTQRNTITAPSGNKIPNPATPIPRSWEPAPEVHTHPGSISSPPLVIGEHQGPTQQKPAQQDISRRTLIGGLTVLAGLGVFIAWEIFHDQPALSKKLFYTYRGHSEWVNRVAWSRDGKRIASASKDATVQVWDAFNGGHAYTYTGHPDEVSTVAWSPDGTRIASAGWDKTVQVWDAATGTTLCIYRGHSNQIDTVAWSPNSTHIASVSYDHTVQVWNASNGERAYTYTGHSDLVTGVAWSPDGTRIASSGNDNTVQVWDAFNGGHAYTYTGHSNVVGTIGWKPGDGTWIASGSHDRTVQVWRATDGTRVYTYRSHIDDVFRVAWSLDGKRIASASKDTTVQVWDVFKRGYAYIYKGHSDQVFAVAWSPDSKSIASAGADKTVQVWAAP